jgi:mannan endo-1,4-beta-mannosidase
MLTRTSILIIIVFFAAVHTGCERDPVHAPSGIVLVDPDATHETRALYHNLDRIRQDHILFGHQDDLAYGVRWFNEPGRSDVKEVTGSYPAVYGWELGDLEKGAERNLDDVEFNSMQEWIREGYLRGGVITISWHMNNPVSGGHAWDTSPAMAEIKPGGSHHDLYREWLDLFADFIESLTVPSAPWSDYEHLIPIVFRPFHEHNGDWFWWGKGIAQERDFIEIWRFTVEYLRDSRELHNLLYAFSPDRSRMNIDDFEREYLYAYPGDAFVDIIGIDNYWDVGHPANTRPKEEGIENLGRTLGYVTEIAEARNKIPALTETGYEALTDPVWWTDVLLEGIKQNPAAQRIAWLLVWRNGNAEVHRPGHFYASYPGHESADNFILFRNDPLVLFEDDLPIMYNLP